MKLQNYLSIALLSVFLASCSLHTMTLGFLGEKQPSDSDQEMAAAVTPPPAPVKSETATVYPQSDKAIAQRSDVAKTTTAAEKHIVARDETLYSIAKRYQVDLNELRQRNGIGSDNIISVGQTLIIRPAQTLNNPVPAPAPIEPVEKAQDVALESSAEAGNVSANEIAHSQEAPAVATPEPATPEKPRLSTQSWVWPLKGEVVRQFNPKGIGTNGIRIRGSKGQAVHATQNGVVVYKGRGLSGYGTIVILSHDNGLLSTYGFLSKTHVEEGQEVRKRETIGTVGPANDKKLTLYFEVREKGDPINPMIQIGNTYRF